MNFKLVILMVGIVFLCWFIFGRTKLHLPAKIAFQSATFREIRKQSVHGAVVVHYATDGETMANFSQLLILSVWDKNKITLEDFDKRYIDALRAQGGEDELSDDPNQRHCVLVKSSPASQLIFNRYFSKDTNLYQVSLTTIDSESADSDLSDLCSSGNPVWQNLNQLEAQVLGKS